PDRVQSMNSRCPAGFSALRTPPRREPGCVRVAIVAESFLPHMNGVTGSILHILTHLERRGHEALVLAPRAAGMPHEVHGAPVEALPSMPLPGYPDVRVGAVTAHRVALSLSAF